MTTRDVYFKKEEKTIAAIDNICDIETDKTIVKIEHDEERGGEQNHDY